MQAAQESRNYMQVAQGSSTGNELEDILVYGDDDRGGVFFYVFF